MSLECPSNPVYHTSAQQKLHSKNAAKVYRFGTPKLRDLLREKCRIRVREARQGCFQKMRKLEDIGLEEILRQELAELEKDIALQEEIYKELVDELNEWFAEQLEEQAEQEKSYLINVAESEVLLCPVCQKKPMESLQVADKQLYKCACKASFCFAGDERELRSALRIKIDLHEQKCLTGLSFFIEPKTEKEAENVLNAFCEKCDYFCSF